MEFDIIIGNPPYQDSTGGGSAENGAVALYPKFIELAWRITRSGIITFIIPSRWFSGGKALGALTSKMLSNKHIEQIVCYSNSKEIFPDNSIAGGVMYYLENRSKYFEKIQYTHIFNGSTEKALRILDEYDIFLKSNDALGIFNKIREEESMEYLVGNSENYKIPTNFKGIEEDTGLKCIISSGIVNCEPSDNINYDRYAVYVSRITYEHAGEPDKNGQYRVLSKISLLEPWFTCSSSYIVIGEYSSREEAELMAKWLKTKLVRFILNQCIVGIHVNRHSFRYVPIYPKEFSLKWSDLEVYRYYGLTENEISYIEKIIKEIE